MNTIETVVTPLEMMLLIEVHALQQNSIVPESEARERALVRFHHNGLIDRADFPKLTAKGEFYLKECLSLPFPVEEISYRIPRGDA